MKERIHTGLAAIVAGALLGLSVAGCSNGDTQKGVIPPKKTITREEYVQREQERVFTLLPQATMSNQEYSLINQRIAEYVIPEGRLGTLDSMSGDDCWRMQNLVDKKFYARAQEISSEAKTREERLCDVDLLLGYIKKGYEHFKKGNVEGSKQFYQAAKDLAVRINRIIHPSDNYGRYTAVTLLLPVLHLPLSKNDLEKLKYSELTKSGSIYAPLLNSAKVVD